MPPGGQTGVEAGTSHEARCLMSGAEPKGSVVRARIVSKSFESLIGVCFIFVGALFMCGAFSLASGGQNTQIKESQIQNSQIKNSDSQDSSGQDSSGSGTVPSSAW